MGRLHYQGSRARRGFSLLELSMVLVVSGLMVSFVLQANQQTAPTNDCYVVTKAQVNTIRAAIERFARKNDRLPLPAARNIGIENIKYGREATVGSADIDTYGSGATSITYGALPFQALGLSPSFASDCWGNKFSYGVTTALTTNASSGGFLDSQVLGNITVKSSPTVSVNTKAAYAIISHGQDELGSVKANFTAANPSHGWCSGTALKQLNCNVGAAVADAVFNNGKDAGANYFDDVIIVANKPPIIANAVSAYCWGLNSYGMVGDGTTTPRSFATPVLAPAPFTQISNGGMTTCALTQTGLAYCWGGGYFGEIGNNTGGMTTTKLPQAVTMPVGVTFTQISVGGNHVLALGSNNKMYCWGDSGSGQCGLGVATRYYTPTPMTSMPSGVSRFTQVSAGYFHSCAIGDEGNAYCWGTNANGLAGDGSSGANVLSPAKVTKPGSVSRFVKISAGRYSKNVCALADTGNAYCWGKGQYGALGNNSTSNSATPVLVDKSGLFGLDFFVDIVTMPTGGCALGNDSNVYCWGNNGWGQLGDNTGADSSKPVKATNPSPLIHFIALMAPTVGEAGGIGSACALGNDYNMYCWGDNGLIDLGDGTNTQRYVPTKVVATTGPVSLGTVGEGRCALVPLPPISWGTNSWGQMGDTTTTDRLGGAYASIPSGVDGLKMMVGGATRCALSTANKPYCWGLNNKSQVGDATTENRKVPTPAALPSGVNTFGSLATIGQGISCGIADNGKPYCWGDWMGTTPRLINVPSVTVLKMRGTGYGLSMVGSNNQAYYYSTSYDVMSTITLPGGVTSVKAFEAGSAGSCLLGNDDQIYCAGNCSSGDCAIGDGVTTSTATYVPVDRGALTGFRELSVGDSGGGWFLPCAIGNDDVVYCWGKHYGGMMGNGTNGNVKPLPVTMPAGVTHFRNLHVGSGVVYAQGNDGNMYYWGMLSDSNSWPYSNASASVPTRLPVPFGATAAVSCTASYGCTFR